LLLTSPLERSKWLASCSSSFTTRGKNKGIHWPGGYVCYFGRYLRILWYPRAITTTET